MSGPRKKRRMEDDMFFKHESECNGIDSWTSNGYGLATSEKLTPTQKESARRINAEIAAMREKDDDGKA